MRIVPGQKFSPPLIVEVQKDYDSTIDKFVIFRKDEDTGYPGVTQSITIRKNSMRSYGIVIECDDPLSPGPGIGHIHLPNVEDVDAIILALQIFRKQEWGDE